MNEEELIQETRRLIGRWDNVRIVGQGWAGDARRGFQFNPIRTRSEGGTTPVTTSGACCPVEGDCFIATQSICEAGGGTYQGDDTTCDPNPCPPPMPPCCPGAFNAFDGSGRKFLTKTVVSFQRRRDYTVEACFCSGTGNPVGEIIWEYQFTTVTSIDPDTCIETSAPCTGYSFKTDDSCVPFGPCTVSDCTLCFPSGFLVFMAITDSTSTTATTEHITGFETFPGSDCTVFQIDRTDDYLTTLSDECTP